MEYEIKKDKEKLTIIRKDELANGETANSSIEQDKDRIILQMNKNHHHS